MEHPQDLDELCRLIEACEFPAEDSSEADALTSFFQIRRSQIQELSVAVAETKKETEKKNRLAEELLNDIRLLEIELEKREIEAVKRREDEENNKNLMNNLYRRRVDAVKDFSKRDIEFIDSIRKKLKAYQRLTGVYWDPSECNKDSVRGFVCNKDSSGPMKLQLFKFHLNNMEDVTEQLWSIIEKSSTPQYSPDELVKL